MIKKVKQPVIYDIERRVKRLEEMYEVQNVLFALHMSTHKEDKDARRRLEANAKQSRKKVRV